MIHPLSAAGEITFYLKDTDSKAILVLDMFYEKVQQAVKDLGRPVKIIVARIQDELKFPLNILYPLTLKKRLRSCPTAKTSFVGTTLSRQVKTKRCPKHFPRPTKRRPYFSVAAQPGTSKGILLSNLNMNALGMEVAAAAGFTMEGLRIRSRLCPCSTASVSVSAFTRLLSTEARAYSFRSSPLRHMPDDKEKQTYGYPRCSHAL